MADVGAGVLATIKGVYQDNIAKEGAPEELKWVVEFDEIEKPMVLNSTNGQIIAQITKQDDTDNWPGAKVVLYDDPSVSYGGKLVGGIRVRAPRGLAAKAAAPAAPTHGMMGKPIHQPAKIIPRTEERAETASPIEGDDMPF